MGTQIPRRLLKKYSGSRLKRWYMALVRVAGGAECVAVYGAVCVAVYVNDLGLAV